MNSNHENHQFGQGSKVDKRQEQNAERHPETKKNINPRRIDDDFLSGDNEAGFHPNLDKYEITIEDEDRYNYGTSEHGNPINIEDQEEDSKPRYSSLSRNGSHRNH